MTDNERPFIPNKYTRFLSKVETFGFDPEKCWPWRGGSKGNGYGNVRDKKTNVSAHRRSYELFVSRDIPDGMDVCHTCDNRWCVNPDHLFLGTRKQNVDDMISKGRGAGGCRKHLTEKQVQEVKQRLLSGHQPRRIANQMGLNYHTVTSIRRGDSYVGLGK